MEENKQNETKQTEVKSAAEVVGEAPKSISVLEEIRKENLEMQEQLKIRDTLIAQRNELRAREMLGGRSEAGLIKKTPEQEQEEIIDKQVTEALKRFRL